MGAEGYDVVTFGETMYCLVPDSAGPMRYVKGFQPRIAGTESNTAIGLAKLGRPAAWISRLGSDEAGHFVLNNVRAEGVDVAGVVMDPEHRTGVMFKEMSAGETSVYYYRENSAASHMRPADLPEATISRSKILHLTGITPILSADCAETVEYAMTTAERNGVALSFDPNVRKKLWRGQDFGPFLASLTLRCQYVMLGVDEAEAMFGLREPKAIIEYLLSHGRAKAVAVKNGADGSWVADTGSIVEVPPVPCTCVEPIGAGDAFNAGFLTGLLENQPIAMCGAMGNIAGAMATQVPGDIEGYPSRAAMQAKLDNTGTIYR